MERTTAATCAVHGASVAVVSADRLAGIRQVCPHSGVAVQKDPGPEGDLRQQEWCAPLGQQLLMRGVDAVTG